MPKSKGPEWDQVIIVEPEGNNRAGVCKVQCKCNAKTMAPHVWWEQYGKEACPDLQPIAIKLLSLSATASCCEQNWSSFGYVYSNSRNRLTTKHATDLVWVYSNLRLAKRTQALGQQGKAQPWVEFSEEEEGDAEGSSSGGDFSEEEAE